MTKKTIESVYGMSVDLVPYEDGFFVVPKKNECDSCSEQLSH